MKHMTVHEARSKFLNFLILVMISLGIVGTGFQLSDSSLAAAASGPQVVFAVKCGGGQYTDPSGVLYRGDMNFSGGQTYQTSAPIAGTTDGPLYQSERWGKFSYNIPVMNGTYNVTLKFAELYCSTPGCRVFSAKIEGREVITNLDVLAKAGGKNRAYDVTVPVTVSDGILNIQFYSAKGDAKVNAILVTSGQPGSSYTITASAGAGGAITPSGVVNVAAGGTQTFTITPNGGYQIMDVKVDGESKGPVNTLTIGNVTASHVVEATFRQAPDPVVTASAGAGGTILPSGTVAPHWGMRLNFAINANAGYRIVDVKVDGISQGAISYYTFQSVTANHTIEASFALEGSGPQVVFAVNCGGPQYTDKSGVVYKADLNFSGGQTYQTTAPIAGTNDGVLYQSERYGNFPYNIPVQNGSYNVTLKFAEIYAWQKGQRLFKVKIEGREVITNLDLFDKAGGKNIAYDLTFPVTVNDGMLTIEFITVANSAKVNAILVTSGQPVSSYTITASAGAGGAISPSGAVSVASGGSKAFTITANAGYRVADVKVDGTSQGAISSYTFPNVTASHSIEASFSPIVQLTITASGGAGGTITPLGTVMVNPGSSQAFTMTPNPGYRIVDVKVDNVSQGTIPSYTFQNVSANHSIAASFGPVDTLIDFYGNQVHMVKLFGQFAFGENSEGAVVGNRIFHASGVVIDRSSRPNKIYVPDTGNNRILGFNGLGVCQNDSSRKCTNDTDCPGSLCQLTPDKEADLIFGQPDNRMAACNRDSNIGMDGPTAADALCLTGFPRATNTGESWMKTSFDVDSQGNLYIVDTWNNRVLKYNQPFSVDKSNGKGDRIADFVLGQPDFQSNKINHGLGFNARDDHSLSTSVGGSAANRGVSADPQGNVWVADTFNGRVLRFPPNSPNADLVLGQANFTARDWSNCERYDWHPWDAPLNRMCKPTIARVDPVTGELYVVEEYWYGYGFPSRILLFKPPFSNGMAAEKIIPVRQDGMIEGHGGGTEVTSGNINMGQVLSILKGDPNNLEYQTLSAKLSAQELSDLKQVLNADHLTDSQRNIVVRVFNDQRSPFSTTLWNNPAVQFVEERLEIEGQAIPADYPNEGNLFFRKLHGDGVILVDPATRQLSLRPGSLTTKETKNLEWFLNGLLVDIFGRETFNKRHYYWQFTGLDINYYRQGEYAQGLIWVSDLNVRRLILLDRDGNILKVVGAPDKYRQGCDGGLYERCNSPLRDGEGFNLCWMGGSVGMDNASNLYLADEHFMRINRFALPYNTRVVGDKVCLPMANGGLFKTTSGNAVSGYKFRGSVGTFTYGNQLVVKDSGRYLVWENYLQKEIGARADFVIGQPADDSRAGLPWNTLGTRGTHGIDDKGRMWTFNGHGKLIVFQMPFTRGAAPLADFVKLYWIDDQTEVDYGGGEKGLAFDKVNKKLWMIENGHRLLRIANYADFPNKLYVDMVIGQPNKTSRDLNRGQGHPSADSFGDISQIRFDQKGNLFVVDNTYECHANARVIAFMAEDLRNAQGLFPNLQAKQVFVSSSLTQPAICDPHHQLNQPHSPVAVAFNSRNEMVIGNDGYYSLEEERAWKQLWFYRDPLKKNADGSFVQGQKPDAYIRLPMGAAAELSFDSQDNMVIQDHTWCRVWVINLDLDPSWLVPVNQ